MMGIKQTARRCMAAAISVCLCAVVSAARMPQPMPVIVSRRSALSDLPQADSPHTEAAQQVKLTMTSKINPTGYHWPLDDNEKTWIPMGKDLTLYVKGKSAFSGLYIKFQKPCEWTVTLPDGTTLPGGQNGMIHEWLPLGQSVETLELHLPKGAMLCDVYAFTDGTLPDWVQTWEPPCEEADLMVMTTHSDDELLWFGGALPYYAGELGYKVQVVYMTNHFSETIRCHEQINGLWTVGVRQYPIITDQFPDKPATRNYDYAVDYYGYDNVLSFQVEMLRRFRPKVIIAQDIKGEYGHGAHIINVKTLMDALELTDDPTAFPDSAEKYGTCKVQKVYLHLWPEHTVVMDWDNMPLSRFGGKTALDMAKRGFACHVSQQDHFFVSDTGKYDCRKFGLAYTNVGWDTPDSNDMFEHVVWSEESPGEEAAPTVISASDGEVSPSDAMTGRGYKQMAAIAGITVVSVTVVGVIVLFMCRKKKK